MSVPPRYLDGFLAAARPADRIANVPSLSVQAPDVEKTVPSDCESFEENTKRRLHPLDAFGRLLDCAAMNFPPYAEDCFRFQWFGLFYQAPAQDAFHLRLRLPGGSLRPFQLAGLAQITQRFAGGQIVLNPLGGLEVPGVPITAAARILSEVESIGLSARRTGGDCVQRIRGGEYDGADPGGNGASIYPLVRALEQAVSYGRAFSDLPRPCEIVFESAGETAAVCDPLVETLVLREIAREVVPNGEKPAASGDSHFVLLVPGAAGNGFLLARVAVVPACLTLLESWQSCADRSSGEDAGLANFLNGFDADALGALLGGAGRVSMPSKPVRSIPKLNTSVAVPGARLLSGHLAALERCCMENRWRELRLIEGCLQPVGMDGGWMDGVAVLTHALSS